MITIQMPMVLKKQYKAKYIVNLVNEKEYYGDIVIKGVNEYQGITLYDEDGSTVIAKQHKRYFDKILYNEKECSKSTVHSNLT